MSAPDAPAAAVGSPAGADPMVPEPYRVRSRRRETEDTWTLALEPAGDGPRPAFAPGQFTMLSPFGGGECAISISGDPGGRGPLIQTIRAVGLTTRALCATPKGGIVGVRGPYGEPWPVAEVEGADVVFVAGGIGLATLRPAILHVLGARRRYGRVVVLVGGREPGQVLYPRELERWRRRGAEVGVTVDVAGPDWRGRVGVVTELLDRAGFDAGSAVAMTCGPEVMMRFALRALARRGVPAERTYVTLERNMQCGIGHCGHCQLGPTLLCRDGPVYPAGEVAPWMAVREL